MSIAQNFLQELLREAKATHALLASVPFDQADFKPHEKSMTLGRLAAHVTEINGWWKECLVQDELDFAKHSGPPKTYASTEDMVAWHDTLIEKATAILTAAQDEDFAKNWTMRAGPQVFFTLPKEEVCRTWCLNHLYHHRAQLGVYLRLLDIPVPQTYGPSADFS